MPIQLWNFEIGFEPTIVLFLWRAFSFIETGVLLNLPECEPVNPHASKNKLQYYCIVVMRNMLIKPCSLA